EAVLLAAMGSVIGLVLGIPLCHYLKINGIDTSVLSSGSVSFSGVAFDPIWRASLDMKSVFISLALVWTFCLLSSLYPAIIAARLDPVKTMRR
ncbi:MAG: hypothetical protein ABIH23_24715, partial [bacterium]